MALIRRAEARAAVRHRAFLVRACESKGPRIGVAKNSYIYSSTLHYNSLPSSIRNTCTHSFDLSRVNFPFFEQQPYQSHSLARDQDSRNILDEHTQPQNPSQHRQWPQSSRQNGALLRR